MAPKNNLVDLLAYLYETQSKSRRVVVAAGLYDGQIDFKDNAKENWHNILAEAKKHNKVLDLVKIASEEYEVHTEDLMILSRPWTLKTSTFKTISGSVQALSRQRDVQVAAPGQSITSPIQFRPQFPSKEPVIKEHTDEEADVLIGRELHWDRISVARMFLNMIKRQDERPLRVLGIQAPLKEDLDSLVNRFEEMCKNLALRMPLLYGKVPLREALGADWRLATAILNALRENARHSPQPVVMSQVERLTQARVAIERRWDTSDSKSLTGSELCDILTDCLEGIARECSVALFLPRFEQLRDSKGEDLQSGKWLRDLWLPEHACNVKKMAILITGDRGLDQLAKINNEEIFCYHPDIAPLPSMKPKDFEEWARDGFGFKEFTYQTAEQLYDACHGSPREFAKFLTLKKIEMSITKQ
jgi:hypothetical protein